MTQRNSLMEWLEQTKRLSKAEDYMGLEIVDTVSDNLWLLDKSFIEKHKKIFNDLCTRYHKPNPVKLFTKTQIEKEFKKDHGKTRYQWYADICSTLGKKKNCRLLKYVKSVTREQLDLQLARYEKASEILLWQWFEIIDFMYERPELINPNLIDDYIETTINRVCILHRKNNPFLNGMKARFGKFWKDKNGVWCKERRNRF